MSLIQHNGEPPIRKGLLQNVNLLNLVDVLDGVKTRRKVGISGREDIMCNDKDLLLEFLVART